MCNFYSDQIEKQQIEVQTLQTECIQLRSDNDTKQLKNRELTALVEKLKDDMKRREHSTPTKVLTGVTHGHERHEGGLTSSEYPSLSPSHGHAHQKQSHHAVEYVHDDISDSMIPSPLNIQPRDTDGTLDNTSSTSTSSYEHMDHYNQASGMGNGTMSPVPTSNVADVYTDRDDAGRLVDKSGDTRMGGDMMIVREVSKGGDKVDYIDHGVSV